jgi:hypothetical protein
MRELYIVVSQCGSHVNPVPVTCQSCAGHMSNRTPIGFKSAAHPVPGHMSNQIQYQIQYLIQIWFKSDSIPILFQFMTCDMSIFLMIWWMYTVLWKIEILFLIKVGCSAPQRQWLLRWTRLRLLLLLRTTGPWLPNLWRTLWVSFAVTNPRTVRRLLRLLRNGMSTDSGFAASVIADLMMKPTLWLRAMRMKTTLRWCAVRVSRRSLKDPATDIETTMEWQQTNTEKCKTNTENMGSAPTAGCRPFLLDLIRMFDPTREWRDVPRVRVI